MPSSQSLKSLVQVGAAAGMASILSYLTVAFFDWPTPITFLLAMLFPMLGIVSLFSIKEFIADRSPSYANSLGFTFGSLAFTICAVFLSAQLAVQTEINTSESTANQEVLKLIKKAVRTIDMGMDVAWDMFIGAWLLLFFLAVRPLAVLKGWGMTGGLLGLALIVLNVYTFPIPPADANLFDLGPFIALYLFALHVRMWVIGRQIS